MIEFQQEPAPTADALWALAREYQQRTEAYDRTVCTGPVGVDGVMPATPRELALIGRHAQDVLRSIRLRAERDGYSVEQLQEAMRAYGSSAQSGRDLVADFPST
ncbi:MAG: hypothetical protein DI603_14980 [Roseateles depolymerans]|uniref:Uncharacterized protein n=1 Tax=Roseateles depolymerans TaxID=76731 RepID=A0A2W5DEX3_9BURK|nr:MAG: hypothetical protein DI603_14980 [Roseateles depolymerans]